MANRQRLGPARSAEQRSTESANLRSRAFVEGRSKGAVLFYQVVIGGSNAASRTSVADTASSTPSILKISTLEGLLTRAIVFLTLKCFLAICRAMRLSSSSAVTARIASA